MTSVRAADPLEFNSRPHVRKVVPRVQAILVPFSSRGKLPVVLCTLRDMVTFYHRGDLGVIFEHLDGWNLELCLPPSFHTLEIHEQPLPGGVVIDDENRTSVPLDTRKDVMLPHLMSRRQRSLDLGNEFVRILHPDHLPWPFDFYRVFHLSCRQQRAPLYSEYRRNQG